jgi:plasmid stabilization system protein ParE
MASRHRRVVWSRSAADALDDAIAFIASDSPSNARGILERILSAAASLATFSERGTVVPEVGDPTIRQLLADPYRLIYQVQKDRVQVLALLHQRRDVALWSRQKRE